MPKKLVPYVSAVTCLLMAIQMTWAQESMTPEAAKGEAGKTAERPKDPHAAAAEARRAQFGRARTAAQTSQKSDGVNVAFKDMSMDKLAVFLGDLFGKPVLADEKIKDKKLTILAKSQVSKKESLQIIQGALLQNGIVIQESTQYIQLLPVEMARQLQRKLLDPDQRVADEVNDAQIVDKLFQLKHYNVQDMQKIITPMLPQYASIVMDKNQRQLLITDSVLNLKRLEAMIDRLDTPDADLAAMRTFQLKHLSPSDVIQLVGPIFGVSSSSNNSRSSSSSSMSRYIASMRAQMEAMKKQQSSRSSSSSRSRSSSSGANSVTTGEDAKLQLYPDDTRNQLLAIGPKVLLDKFAAYVEKVDRKAEEETIFDVYTIKFADVAELANQIEDVVDRTLARDMERSFKIVPLTASSQLLVFGPQNARSIARKMIDTLDLENSDSVVYEEFMLKYASASTVEQKIEDLFVNQQVTSRSYWTTSYSNSADKNFRITTDSDRNSVTVFGSKTKLDRIRELIKEWDVPIKLEDVEPKIYKLKYADPLQMKEILEEMYADTGSSSGFSFFGGGSDDRPANRLAGQFTFQALKNSNKLIVTTTATENFKVIDKIIDQLDQAEDTGLPTIIELKHANAEELSEQLNALFAERGTRAEIPRSERDLSTGSALTSTQTNRNNNNNNNNNNNRQNQARTTPGFMGFWWSQGSRAEDEQEASNLIGQPRIIPVYRRNALMIMAPLAHQQKLKELIVSLDQPGRQVVIRAIAMEIRHDKRTTVGARFASDPSLFSDARLVDSAVTGSSQFDFSDLFFKDRGVLNTSVDLAFLLQLLQRNFETNIIREPMLYTADNQEASFFDGQDVPFQSDSNVTSDGNVNRSFEYRPVGTQVRVRPHITQDGMVSLQTNIEISRVVDGESVLGNAVFDRIETSSRNIVQSGQTIMISGIVRQENQKDDRKLPGIGDIPGVGGIFGSKDREGITRELIIFLTPVVVDEKNDVEKIMSEQKKKLTALREKMASEFEKINKPGKFTAKQKASTKKRRIRNRN